MIILSIEIILISEIILKEMTKSALRTLIKRTNLEMLYQKMVKNNIFHFLKVKKC